MDEPEQDIRCYYALIYHHEGRGNIVSFFTEWVGFADDARRIELRKPSITSLSRLMALHERSQFGAVQFVETPIDFYRFWIKGGFAAIRSDVAEKLIPERLEASPVTSTGYGPFESLGTSISAATQRAPSKKTRLKILERDKFRCIICGQRPSEDPNVVLNVHHIRPWENHGATVASNLVTLCHTCHMGLDPHYNSELARLVDDPEKWEQKWKTPPKPFDDD
jgi:hypothetical protein